MKRKLILALIGLLTANAGAEVQIQQPFAYGGWANCVRLSNGRVELVATTDVGPRVIRFAFVGGSNVFREWPEQVGQTGGDQWRIYGGHRLWHAPENQPRTYAPDNAPVEAHWDGKTLTLTEPVEPSTGIQKQMAITLDPEAAHVTVVHRLTNKNIWGVELAPWAISAMPAGGRAIFPQEPERPHPEALVPVRTIALWAYTDMTDPRWTWGRKYIQLRCDPDRPAAQKGGVMNTLGWAAYAEPDLLFLDRFGFSPNARYPDLGCNVEAYTGGDMLELETFGPLTRVPPNGSVAHVEHWFLYQLQVGTNEASIDEKVLPLVRQTEPFKPRL
ncbi:MAG: DUF4380 domain-containing protein [Verrucomicrobia bacterium]|nr:DUF4380 domain-containing protein [Verrucomicrobiota bacterium]